MYGIEIIFAEKCLAWKECNFQPIATRLRDSHCEVVIGWSVRGIYSGVDYTEVDDILLEMTFSEEGILNRKCIVNANGFR